MAAHVHTKDPTVQYETDKVIGKKRCGKHVEMQKGIMTLRGYRKEGQLHPPTDPKASATRPEVHAGKRRQ